MKKPGFTKVVFLNSAFFASVDSKYCYNKHVEWETNTTSVIGPLWHSLLFLRRDIAMRNLLVLLSITTALSISCIPTEQEKVPKQPFRLFSLEIHPMVGHEEDYFTVRLHNISQEELDIEYWARPSFAFDYEFVHDEHGLLEIKHLPGWELSIVPKEKSILTLKPYTDFNFDVNVKTLFRRDLPDCTVSAIVTFKYKGITYRSNELKIRHLEARLPKSHLN